MRISGLLLCCLLLWGCATPDSSWFPLAAGYWWQYSVTRSIRGEAHEQKLVIASLPVVSIKGERLYPRRRPDGREEYFEKSATGIARVDTEDGSRTVVLQVPFATGTRWQGSSRILFLEVSGAFEATYNRHIRQDIRMDYEIDSVSELVKVKAGVYRNCLRVKGSGSLYGGGGSMKEFMNIDSINIDTVDWYAPGIGLVKRTRREYTLPERFENQYSEELQAFRRR